MPEMPHCFRPLPPSPVGAPKLPESMRSFRVALPVPAALLALSATENVPVTDGVPLMTPVVALTLSPKGSPVAAKLVGLLEAVMV